MNAICNVCKSYTVERGHSGQLGVPQSVLLDDITQIAYEKCVVFVLYKLFENVTYLENQTESIAVDKPRSYWSTDILNRTSRPNEFILWTICAWGLSWTMEASTSSRLRTFILRLYYHFIVFDEGIMRIRKHEVIWNNVIYQIILYKNVHQLFCWCCCFLFSYWFTNWSKILKLSSHSHCKKENLLP